jgi:chaperone modulatory protein CbpM
MRETDPLTVLEATALEDACLSLEQLASACASTPDWVIHRVEEGILSCATTTVAAWRFSSRDLDRARRVRALERDFDASPELAALVADLQEEIAALRRRLRRAGLD